MAAPWSELLAFWFGPDAQRMDDGSIAARQAARWWQASPVLDAEIRRRFSVLHARAVEGALAEWTGDVHGRLALILLGDQISRHLYRGSALAFTADPAARHWCLDGLVLRVDQLLRPIERVFFYLPLEHSESLADQERAVALLEALADRVPPAQRPHFDRFADYARQHRDIIARFGRFPHRNASLGRASTPEERAFLQQPGSSF